MGAAATHHAEKESSMTARGKVESGRSLRKKRLRAHLSLQAVGRYFRGGVTKQRLAQIESSRHVQQGTVDAYQAAISAALEERARVDEILKRVSVEVNERQNTLQGKSRV